LCNASRLYNAVVQGDGRRARGLHLRPRVPLKPGDNIDRFVIDGLLGAGGMGEVYRARDTRLQRNVALKILHPQASSAGASGEASSGAARMLREARAAAALDHPNVVAIFDVGQIEAPEELKGTTFLAMELIKGHSLRKYSGDLGVPMAERVRWLVDVARALAAAHRAGLVHRDVKPENVMLREDGLVKVLDFGVAKRAVGAPVDPTSSTEGYVVPSTTAGLVVGTPLYMAPEQLRAEPLDGRADQFSWGVLAYEMLSGAVPWLTDGGGIAVVAQILSATPKPLSSFADVPPAVAATVTRAMQKDPGARFASMEDVIEGLAGKVDALAPAVAGEGVAEQRTLPSVASRPTEREQMPSGATPPTEPSPTPAPAPTPLRSRAAIFALAGVAAIAAAAYFATRRDVRTSVPSATVSSSVALPGCSGHRACIDAHGGEAWVCRSDRTCAPLASVDCTATYDAKDLESDDAVWMGAMLPLSGPRGDIYGKQAGRVLELARRDFASVGGVLGAEAAQMRPLGLVVCDSDADARRAAAHLADIEAPVVIGFTMPLKDVLDVLGSVFIPRRVLAFDVFDESPLVTRIPQPDGAPRLVWRLTASAVHDGDALAHLVSDWAEPWLRRPGGPVARGAEARLAIVRSDATIAASITDAAASTIRLNDKPLVENTAAFRQLTFKTGASAEANAALVAELVAFAPHLVAYAGGRFFEDTFLAAIERAWRAPFRPLYVSTGSLDAPGLQAFVGADASRRRRFLSVDLPANTDANFKFALHYNEYFEPKITPGTAPGVVYDAFYVAAYAIAATRKRHPSGSDVAEAMKRLGGDGPQVAVGAPHIFDAYDVLRSGAQLHIVGAGTQLDFDHASGEIPTDFGVYCLGVDRAGRASDPIESGMRYAHATRRLEGTMRCP
jgi:serine/threonine-protein kinase